MCPATARLEYDGADDVGRARLSLLGSFALSVEAEPLRLPLTAQRLLALLCLMSPVDRSTAASRLWPDAPGGRAAASLRTVLSKVQHLCPAAIGNGGTYLSLGSSVASDVGELRAVASHVIAVGDSPMEAALRLMELRGELLPSWDDEWLIFDREELRQVRLQALESCSARLLRAGYCAAALMLAYEAIRTDRFRESAYRRLIEIHLAQGNQVQAVEVYRSFARQLWQDCGVRPSRRLHDLLDGLVAAESSAGARVRRSDNRQYGLDPPGKSVVHHPVFDGRSV